MLKLAVTIAVFVGVALGAPPSVHPMLDGRIVGGVDTTIEEHPYIISLLRTGSHICGGVRFSDSWIVTAAHCVVGGTVSSFSIRAGSTIRNSGGQVIPVSRVLVHASYESRTTDFDVAALFLTVPITIASSSPIPLVPIGTGPAPGSIATITGWGALSEGGAAANILQVVQVPVVSTETCQDAYGVSAITPRMFCAGYIGQGGLDACQGDSGGPVVVGGQAAGLVSWGAGCARPNHPGVKTNLFPLRNWIDSATATGATVGTLSDVIELS